MITLAAFLAAFPSAETRRTYHKALKAFAALDPATPTAAALERFRDGLVARGLRPRSVSLYITVARRWLEANGITVAMPVLPRPDRRRLPYVTDLQAYLIQVHPLPEPYRTVLMLLPFVGLRISEICSLPVSAVREGMLQVHGKGGVERIVPLSAAAKAILDQYRQGITSIAPPRHERVAGKGIAPLFADARGRAVAPWQVRVYARQVGVTPHMLRRTFATLLFERGADGLEVAELLGHASLSTTRRYVHLLPAGRLRRAVGRLGG